MVARKWLHIRALSLRFVSLLTEISRSNCYLLWRRCSHPPFDSFKGRFPSLRRYIDFCKPSPCKLPDAYHRHNFGPSNAGVGLSACSKAFPCQQLARKHEKEHCKAVSGSQDHGLGCWCPLQLCSWDQRHDETLKSAWLPLPIAKAHLIWRLGSFSCHGCHRRNRSSIGRLLQSGQAQAGCVASSLRSERIQEGRQV